VRRIPAFITAAEPADFDQNAGALGRAPHLSNHIRAAVAAVLLRSAPAAPRPPAVEPCCPARLSPGPISRLPLSREPRRDSLAPPGLRSPFWPEALKMACISYPQPDEQVVATPWFISFDGMSQSRALLRTPPALPLKRALQGHVRNVLCSGSDSHGGLALIAKSLGNSLVFRESELSDAASITGLLRRAFNVDRNSGGVWLHPEHLEWKYWSKHPTWPTSRSYVLEEAGIVVAHTAIWPLRVLTPDKTLSAIVRYDWAADPKGRGYGRAITEGLAGLGAIVLSIGGTPATHKSRQTLGFHPVQIVHQVTRVLSPSAVALRRPRSWRTPLRLIRSVVRHGPKSPPPAWKAEQVSPDDPKWAEVPFPLPAEGRLVLEQTRDHLNFLSNAPFADFKFYIVRHAAKPVGYFVIRLKGHDALLIDAWVETDSEAAWKCLSLLVPWQVSVDTRAGILYTWAPTNRLKEFFHTAGFQSTGAQPLYCIDPDSSLPPDALLHFQLIHTDYCFM
jgi:hypothetical protein